MGIIIKYNLWMSKFSMCDIIYEAKSMLGFMKMCSLTRPMTPSTPEVQTAK